MWPTPLPLRLTTHLSESSSHFRCFKPARVRRIHAIHVVRDDRLKILTTNDFNQWTVYVSSTGRLSNNGCYPIQFNSIQFILGDMAHKTHRQYTEIDNSYSRIFGYYYCTLFFVFFSGAVFYLATHIAVETRSGGFKGGGAVGAAAFAPIGSFLSKSHFFRVKGIYFDVRICDEWGWS